MWAIAETTWMLYDLGRWDELIEWAKTTPDVAVDFFDKALQELQDKGLLVKS